MGAKRWETRSWRFRGPLPQQIAIHASAHPPRDLAGTGEIEPFRSALARSGYSPADLPSGAIVGVVTVAACLPTPEVRELLGREELALGDYSAGRWAWRLEQAIPLAKPIRCKGALGLWDLEWQVEKAVRLQLG